MSADNGVYICHTTDGYRVTHAQAIENLFWNDEIKNYSEDVNLQILADYFGHCEVFESRDEAFFKADLIYQEIMADPYDPCPIIEYGICFLEFQIPFPVDLIKEYNDEQE